MKMGQIEYSGIIPKPEYGSLIKQIRKGNVYAVTDWIERNKDKLYKIARTYAADGYEKEIFKRTVLSILENVRYVKSERSFDIWMISIFLNECNKALRRDNEVSLTSDSGTLDDGVLNSIKKLNGIEKDAVAMKFYGGYSLEDIAAILHITQEDTRHLIYKGLKEIGSIQGGE